MTINSPLAEEAIVPGHSPDRLAIAFAMIVSFPITLAVLLHPGQLGEAAAANRKRNLIGV
jgi:hypothetical protein